MVTPCGVACRAFSRLSARSQALAASGGRAAKVWEDVNALASSPGVINMGQGFPNFEGSSVARDVAAQSIQSGKAALNQYSPQPGLLALRESIAAFQQRRYGATYCPLTEVVVTAGAQESLAAAISAFLDPGDEVVIFEPFYPFMLGAVRLAGAVPRVVTLQAPGFQIDEHALRDAVSSDKVKMLVVNSPHNPTGHVTTQTELDLIAELCLEKDLLAVSDEVYEHAVFDPAATPHLRLADMEGMRDRTITVGSGGKLFSLTGWRVAWALGPAPLVSPLGAVHTHLTFSAPTPLQQGIAAALDVEDGLGDIGNLFARNFQLLSNALLTVRMADDGSDDGDSSAALSNDSIDGQDGRGGGMRIRSICPAQGGYFLVAEVDGASDVDFCRRLAEEKKVACTPMSVFYASEGHGDLFTEDNPCRLVRFTVCKSREYILDVCSALRS